MSYLKTLLIYCTKCKTFKKNNTKKVKKETLIIIQKKIKDIIKKKISVISKLTESNKKLTKKQMTFYKKIQNNIKYNMFEDD